MPLRNCPLTGFNGSTYRPILPIRIVNPHTGKHFNTFGLIDTGADECAIPSYIAGILGHNLQAGTTKTISTGNGLTTAYAHTTTFEIYHPGRGTIAYKISDTPIDFMPNLHTVLLGVNSFLSKFLLQINYPKKVFSISK